MGLEVVGSEGAGLRVAGINLTSKFHCFAVMSPLLGPVVQVEAL